MTPPLPGIAIAKWAVMHPVIATSSLPLFVGALLADWAYSHSHQVQWINFASWLIAGALVIAGLALLWAVVDALRRRPRPSKAYLPLLLATFVLGFVNALVHAKDGAATMPAALILSAVVVIVGLAASAAGLAGWHRRAA